MTDCGNADGLSSLGQLVEDPIGADSQGIQAAKLAAQRITGERVTLEQGKGLLDSVDQWPGQIEQVATSSPSEDQSRQRLAGRLAAFGQLASKLSEGDRLPLLDLDQTLLQRREGVRIGEDLSGLLECLVLVDRNQCRRGGSVAGHHYVVAAGADLIEQAAEVGTELANGNSSCHRGSVLIHVHEQIHSHLRTAGPEHSPLKVGFQ